MMGNAATPTSPAAGTPGSIPTGVPQAPMKFWDDIFPHAMKKFIDDSTPKESRGRPDVYNIRKQKNWDDVYHCLNTARSHYLTKTGIRGRLIHVWRKAADNVQPLTQVVKFVPDIDYVTPVLGAVEVILDVSSMPRENPEVHKALAAM
jgi:hypothetical protein